MLTFLIVDMTAGEVCQASGSPTVIDQRFSGRLDLMLHDGGDRSDGDLLREPCMLFLAVRY